MALSWTLDKLGPLARSAEDLETIFGALTGSDPRDPATIHIAERIEPRPGTLEIGVLPRATWNGYQPEAVASVEAALSLLEKRGHRLVPIELPPFPFEALMLTILGSEAAAAFEPLIRSGRHMELIDPLAKIGLLAATTIPAVDYVNAMRRRRLASTAMAALFDRVDVIAGPSFPSVASPIEANLETWFALPTDPLGAPGNLCGLPAVSVPCGFGEAGLPLGISFLGPAAGASLVLGVAKDFQAASDFHKRRPEGVAQG